MVPNLDILLPVGISFYTFIAAGYIIDIYKGNIKAERNIITYSLFIAFFPQILAGPIGRAKTMLPQFHKEHSFSYNNGFQNYCQERNRHLYQQNALYVEVRV